MGAHESPVGVSDHWYAGQPTARSAKCRYLDEALESE